MKTISLKDITISITDGKHGDCENQNNSGYYFISCKDVYDGFIHYENARQITEADFRETHKRTQLEPNDILITNSGTIGRMALVKNIPETYRTTFQKSVAIVKPDTSVVLPTYLYYKLQNCVADFINCSNGSAQKNLLLGTMREFQIDLHEDFAEQERLTSVLTAYDELIENNQKQIKLLEEATQRLYKEWFVDLHFPGYENTPIVDGVPEGWKKNRADAFFEITIGKTPPRAEKQWFTSGENGIPWLSISDMGNAGVYAFIASEGLTEEAVKKHNMKVVPAGTILVSFKLTVGRVAIANAPMCTNEAIAHFHIEDSLLQAYTYCYLRNYEYDMLGNTSSISKAVNSKIIKAMPFMMPTEDTVTNFSLMVAPILSEIQNRQEACLKLQETRDRLLPKLMSGEIEV